MSAFTTAACSAAPETSIARIRESNFLKNLPVYLSRWEGEWAKIPEDEERRGKVLSKRMFRSVSFDGLGNGGRIRSDSGFATLSQALERDGSGWTSCTEEIYRRFIVGRDTIAFTYGRVPEGCNESPRMIWRRRSGKQHRVVMKPLYDWNVDALWLTPHYLTFGLTASYEGSGIQFVRIACWELETGRWFTSLTRGWRIHRPGFDLPALLPDWFSAHAYEVGSSVVLRGKRTALAFWPKEGGWAQLGTVNGEPIPLRTGRLQRRLLEPAEKAVPPRLKEQIRADLARIHDKAGRNLADFNILEVMKSPCISNPAGYAVLARAVGQDRAAGGPQFDLSRELFAVFLVNPSMTRVTKSFPPFPSKRWDDYAAYFDLDAADTTIAVCGEGATYGDEETRYTYPCAP